MPLTIKCHGEFYSKQGQLKLTVPFTETVKAPNLKFFEQTATKYTGTNDAGELQFKDSTFTNVRGVLKKKLLPLILAKKYAGTYVRVRGVTIDEITADGNDNIELPINLMSINQLAGMIKLKNVPIDAFSYVNVDELRTDVMEYLTDPDVFKRNYARKSKKRDEEKEFMSLNNLLDTPAALPVGAVPAPKASKGIKAAQEATTPF